MFSDTINSLRVSDVHEGGRIAITLCNQRNQTYDEGGRIAITLCNQRNQTYDGEPCRATPRAKLSALPTHRSLR
jgi:hypothetical protein